MTPSGNWRDELAETGSELLDVVERKVKAGTAAATLTAAVTSWLGLYVLHGTVPDWITATVGTLVTGGLTFLVAYRARHTARALPPAAPPIVAGPGVLPDSELPLT